MGNGENEMALNMNTRQVKNARPNWLVDFMKSRAVNNLWLKHETLSLYLRKSILMIEGSQTKCLVLANCMNAKRRANVYANSNAKRTGKFKLVMDALECQAIEHDYPVVYVENVLNEFLPGVLARYGYTMISNGTEDLSPCFYKRVGL